jgi:bifunctional enzyme CysN/CysC
MGKCSHGHAYVALQYGPLSYHDSVHSMQESVDPPADPNVRWHASAADAALRARCAGQHGVTAWLTGLSGSGKSTIAVELEHRLLQAGCLSFCLDGDNLRHGLNAGIGFDAAGRQEAVRRAGEAALLISGAGVVSIVGMISPYRADRDRVRARHQAAGIPFIEVHVDAPLSIAEGRDPKGLYAKARAGEIKGFTGIDDPYEAPLNAEVVLRTAEHSLAACVAELQAAIMKAAMTTAVGR